jgi:hypothetical protein
MLAAMRHFAGLIAIASFSLINLQCGGSEKMEQTSPAPSPQKQGWIKMVGLKEAQGPLKELYTQMKAKSGSRPSVYTPPTGDVANIVKSHSLDPEGMRLAFGMSGAIHWGPHSLPWVKREMLNTVTSRANNCFY